MIAIILEIFLEVSHYRLPDRMQETRGQMETRKGRASLDRDLEPVQELVSGQGKLLILPLYRA